MHFAGRLADWLIPISFPQTLKGLLDPSEKLGKEGHLDEALRMNEEERDDRRGLTR
jgi:hypothetical protein